MTIKSKPLLFSDEYYEQEEVKAQKYEKFKKLSRERKEALFKAFVFLEKCANQSSYYYSKKDLRDLFRSISRRFKKMKFKFTRTSKTHKLKRLDNQYLKYWKTTKNIDSIDN
jgi:NAD-dependent SIR2 family protein deacetylase